MPRFRFFARVAAPVSAVVLLTAGIGIAGPAVATGGRSCDVLKQAEVERAIGHEVEPADPPQGVGGACSFTVDGAPADAVNVWVLEGDDAETGFDVGKQIGGRDVADVPRLGEDAFYLGDPLNTAYVLDDGTLVYLQYYVFSGDDTPKQVKKAVVALTKKALRRATS